jgi:DNA processing protein
MEAAALQSWFTLRAVRELDDASLCRLLQQFGSPDAVRRAPTEALMAAGEIRRSVALAIRQTPDQHTRQAIDREIKSLERLRLRVVTYLDEAYPPRLKAIPDPPPLLYVGGTLDQRDHQAIAIVGSRQATASGRVLTEELSRDLAAAGFTIVSGLARGVDGAAHRGALAAGGRTVAVLGCGLDRTYPPEHEALRAQIEASGAVVGELPLGSYPYGYHFPRRNRIISGMSLGVVVTEAAIQSGSLITARLAAEQGREVFAVPGFVKAEKSRGPNGLIKQGAKLVETAADVIVELLPQLDRSFRERLQQRLDSASPGAGPQLDRQEAPIYEVLSFEPTHIDDLIARTGLPAADVAGLLLAMELKGTIRQLPGHAYIRI